MQTTKPPRPVILNEDALCKCASESGASTMSQLEDYQGAAELRLSADKVARLDAATAPAPLYPQWLHEKTLDAKLKEALGGGSS